MTSLTYRGAWPHVDVKDTVTAESLAEDFVLRSAQAPSKLALKVIGATVTSGADRSLLLHGPHNEVLRVPAPVVSDRHGRDVTRLIQAHYEVGKSPGVGTEIVVRLDAGWMKSEQARSLYPLTVDPLVQLLNPTSLVNYSSAGTTGTSNPIELGSDASGTKWRGAAYFNQYESYFNQGYRVYDAFVNFHFPDLPGTFPVCTPAPCPSSSPTNSITLYDQGSSEPANFAAIGSNVQPVITIKDDNIDTYVYDADAYIPDLLDTWVTHSEAGRWLGFVATEGPISRVARPS